MSSVFSGSYNIQDVQFLLKPVQMEFINVAEKERRIQSGQNHYSEMLSEESLPSMQYMQLFWEAMQRNGSRFARDVRRLSKSIAQRAEQRHCTEITLVSLVRAGTPVGVLLQRCLALAGWAVRHYSLSIIRDRGIDVTALRYILHHEHRQPQGLFFVDGWTGKGVIGAELKKSLAEFRRSDGITVPDALHVVADLSGRADVSATYDDYLLPSSLLNAIISGLVSRSVLNEHLVKQGDFHACVYHEHWTAEDISRRFVDTITAEIQRQTLSISQDSHCNNATEPSVVLATRQKLQQRSLEFLHRCKVEFDIANVNHIKPGIGEATRVLLRRVPHLVLVREKDHVDTRHLEKLAYEKAVPVLVDAHLPYAAAAIIRTTTKDEQ